MLPWQAVVLGVVEGLTEFIPVSSTGHLILAAHFLGLQGEASKTFEVFIQFGAILAILVLYTRRWTKFLTPRGIFILGITTLPALVFGGLLHSTIKHRLFGPEPVILGLFVGGVGILLAERFLPPDRNLTMDDVDWRLALGIGLFQCLALWPGMSRSASTIVGAMILGLNREAAAEYSFFAAVPVIFAATAFDLLKNRAFLDASQAPAFAIGFVVAFVSALITLKIFMGLLKRFTLRGFGYYRIAAAALLHWTLP